jgi:hypothetical protein
MNTSHTRRYQSSTMPHRFLRCLACATMCCCAGCESNDRRSTPPSPSTPTEAAASSERATTLPRPPFETAPTTRDAARTTRQLIAALSSDEIAAIATTRPRWPDGFPVWIRFQYPEVLRVQGRGAAVISGTANLGNGLPLHENFAGSSIFGDCSFHDHNLGVLPTGTHEIELHLKIATAASSDEPWEGIIRKTVIVGGDVNDILRTAEFDNIDIFAQSLGLGGVRIILRPVGLDKNGNTGFAVQARIRAGDDLCNTSRRAGLFSEECGDSLKLYMDPVQRTSLRCPFLPLEVGRGPEDLFVEIEWSPESALRDFDREVFWQGTRTIRWRDLAPASP